MTIRNMIRMTLLAVISMSCHAGVIKIDVSGMVCEFCASGVETTLKSYDGVTDVKVNLDEGTVTVTHSLADHDAMLKKSIEVIVDNGLSVNGHEMITEDPS